MAAWKKCDAILGGNTCNLSHTNPSGLCSLHDGMPDVITLRLLTEWTDAKDEWSDAVREAFPTRSGSHDDYALAMKMVSNRRSKGALVALVNWLLVERGRKR